MIVHRIALPQQLTQKLLKFLRGNNYINKTSSIIWEGPVGFTEQYRCYTAIYMLSLLSNYFQIVIDQVIGAPGH